MGTERLLLFFRTNCLCPIYLSHCFFIRLGRSRKGEEEGEEEEEEKKKRGEAKEGDMSTGNDFTHTVRVRVGVRTGRG